jgi:hypothetical protein
MRLKILFKAKIETTMIYMEQKISNKMEEEWQKHIKK